MRDTPKEQAIYEERSLKTKLGKRSEGLATSYVETLPCKDSQGYEERNRNANLISKADLEQIQKEMRNTPKEEAGYEERLLKTKLGKPSEGLATSYIETLPCKDFQGYEERNRNANLRSKADLEQIQKEMRDTPKEEAGYEERLLKTKLGKPSEGLATSYIETLPCKDFQGYEERNRNANLISKADLEQIQKEMRDTAKEEAVHEERSLKTKLDMPSEGLGTSHTETLPCKDIHGYEERNRCASLVSKADFEQNYKEMEDPAKGKAIYGERWLKTKFMKPNDGVSTSYTEISSSEYFKDYAEQNLIANSLHRADPELIEKEMEDTSKEKATFEELLLSRAIIVKPDEVLDIFHSETLSAENSQGYEEKSRDANLLSRADMKHIEKEIEDLAKEKTTYEELSLKTKLVKPEEGLSISHAAPFSSVAGQCYAERNRNANLLCRTDLRHVEKEMEGTAKGKTTYEVGSLETESQKKSFAL
ncbi:hypothetical protein KIN20_034505 [Parelaphostrongylus tenuis]|uniref:Uncharacterized protein n=1 Tax=Parelaphostrongylus tenuis TaxID=148309 RepID=A0AAD5WJQ4_PARTN|nr:hypothetical protein KIN20_034505 [Parelaphostrongylus tenuis]